MSYQYPRKDRLVRIYTERTHKWRNESAEGEYKEKCYIHKVAHPLHAYIRQIVANQDQTQVGEFEDDKYLVVINYRDLPPDNYYIEWNNRVLKVLSIDGFEWRNEELKLTCQLVNTDTTIYKRIREPKL